MSAICAPGWLSGFGWPVEAVADREQEFVYRGQSDFALPGVLTHEDRRSSAIQRALSDVLTGVTQLEAAGYPRVLRASDDWRGRPRSTQSRWSTALIAASRFPLTAGEIAPV